MHYHLGGMVQTVEGQVSVPTTPAGAIQVTVHQNQRERRMSEKILVAGTFTILIAIMGAAGLGATIEVLGGPHNSPWATAGKHLDENHEGIRKLIEQAAPNPQVQSVLAGLPDQEISMNCRKPDGNHQAEEAIGRTAFNYRLSLYGPSSQVQADYWIFIKHRRYSTWDKFTNRTEYPILDAHLDAGSLRAAGAGQTLRVKQPLREIRLAHISQPETGGTKIP